MLGGSFYLAVTDETCSFYSTEPDVLQAENGSDEAEARVLEEVESSVGREGVVRLVTEGGAVGRGLDAGVGDVQVNVHIQLDPVVTLGSLPRHE